MITEQFGYQHLSAGDLLREERLREGSEHGELINNCIAEGTIVPVEITVRLLASAMKRSKWEGGHFLIDGFPRNFDNLKGWQEVLRDSVNVRFVLCFDCSEAVMEARLMERGKTSGRIDDNIESIKKRFRTFQDETIPVVQYLEGLDLVHRIDAEQSVDNVWASVRTLFEAADASAAPQTTTLTKAKSGLQLTSFSEAVVAKRARRGVSVEDDMTYARPTQPGLGASASVGSLASRRPRPEESQGPWVTSYNRHYQQPPCRRYYYDRSQQSCSNVVGAALQRPLTLEPSAASNRQWQLPTTAQFSSNSANIASPGAAWQRSPPAVRLDEKTEKQPTSHERLKLQAELAMFSTGQLRNALRFAGNSMVSS
jgi:UMP-CMP kinase